MIERDKAIVSRMLESGEPMPLDYMESNMHWYAKQANEYEARALSAKPPTSFRNKKMREAQEKYIAHLQSMAIKMRALNQAAAESSANYCHARIQSVSIGNSRGNRSLTIVLEGSDARL